MSKNTFSLRDCIFLFLIKKYLEPFQNYFSVSQYVND